jgi:hypothetical protein
VLLSLIAIGFRAWVLWPIHWLSQFGDGLASSAGLSLSIVFKSS